MLDRPAQLAILTTLGLMALSPAVISAQDYTQFEVQYMTVKTDALGDLDEALAEHNQEYHSGGPYHANVWYVANGPRTGQYLWVMGPLTFAQLDGRPSVGGHDEDWSGNVLPHLEPQADVSYWRRADNLSHQADQDLHPILRVRFYKFAPGDGFRFREQRRLVKEVFEAKGYPINETVFFPRFRPETGGNAAVVRTFDQWADLDGGGFGQFRADFQEIHGQGAWQRWLNTNGEIIEDSWDEFHQLRPDLSGTN